MSLLVASLIWVAPWVQDAKEVTKDWKHPWAGAAVGTSVKYRVTRANPVPLPGGDAEEEGIVSERTETVTKVEKSTVHTEIKEGEGKPIMLQHHTGLPAELTYPMTRKAEEAVKVGDQTYACTVYEFRTSYPKKGGQKGEQLCRVWKAPNGPVWTVKEQFLLDNEPTWTLELVKTETLKVGEKEYLCAVLQKTTSTHGVKVVETTWVHPDVPGEWGVQRTEQRYVNGKEQKMFSFTAKLVEVVKK